jgi:hypothetical protein
MLLFRNQPIFSWDILPEPNKCVSINQTHILSSIFWLKFLGAKFIRSFPIASASHTELQAERHPRLRSRPKIILVLGGNTSEHTVPDILSFFSQGSAIFAIRNVILTSLAPNFAITAIFSCLFLFCYSKNIFTSHFSPVCSSMLVSMCPLNLILNQTKERSLMSRNECYQSHYHQYFFI